MRDVKNQDIGACPDQFCGALQKVPAGPDRRTSEQAPLFVLGRVGPLAHQYQVLLGDQSPDLQVLVNKRKFLDSSLEKDPLCFCRADIRRTGCQPGHGSHEILDPAILHSVRPRHVAIGEKAGEPVSTTRFLNQNSRDVVLPGKQACFTNGRIARQA